MEPPLVLPWEPLMPIKTETAHELIITACANIVENTCNVAIAAEAAQSLATAGMHGKAIHVMKRLSLQLATPTTHPSEPVFKFCRSLTRSSRQTYPFRRVCKHTRGMRIGAEPKPLEGHFGMRHEMIDDCARTSSIRD
jgi:hypothetical protein